MQWPMLAIGSVVGRADNDHQGFNACFQFACVRLQAIVVYRPG